MNSDQLMSEEVARQLERETDRVAREFLSTYATRRIRYNRSIGAPLLDTDALPDVPRDKSVPTDLHCWLMTIDRRLTKACAFLPAARAILHQVVTQGERYDTVARNHRLTVAEVRQIVFRSQFNFIGEIRRWGITLEYRDARAA